MKKKRIIFVAPKSITRHRSDPERSFRYDMSMWNFFLPLQGLGHEVAWFDTATYGNEELDQLIQRFQPELLFCITTGDRSLCPEEPWDVIYGAKNTPAANIKTFNWFCDDVWRFDEFSSIATRFFDVCSTPERKFVNIYKEKLGYENVIYATWHANPDMYSGVRTWKDKDAAFVGASYGDRKMHIDMLEKAGIKVENPKNASFEDLVHTYARSRIGLNFSKNSNTGTTQMKARVFEIPAAGSVLLTEHHDELEDLFDIGKEIMTFESPEEMVDKAKFLLSHPNQMAKMAEAGFKAAITRHSSYIRLAGLLEEIDKMDKK
tara:strand:+ start:3618 stop:4574 length:957 start_codon:yes stop_codon:yes gene_type:complete